VKEHSQVIEKRFFIGGAMNSFIQVHSCIVKIEKLLADLI